MADNRAHEDENKAAGITGRRVEHAAEPGQEVVDAHSEDGRGDTTAAETDRATR